MMYRTEKNTSMRLLKHTFLAMVVALVLASCAQADGDFPGSEYMPDMNHSIAFEPNVYGDYYLNTWDSASVYTLKELSRPRLPVKGTVPRGYAGVYYAQLDSAGDHSADVVQVLHGENTVNAIATPVNGSVPFYYGTSEEERARAIEEITGNPFPITDKGLAQGSELYNVYCGICHGSDAGGVGYLVSEDNTNAAYPAAPANLLLEEHVQASNGRYYWTLIHGRNLMGAYADKLSYEERWQVIHYIRSLQASSLDLEYSEEANTLNPAHGTPASQLGRLAEGPEMEDDMDTGGEAASDTEENSSEGH